LHLPIVKYIEIVVENELGKEEAGSIKGKRCEDNEVEGLIKESL
jgi:hypothetical protein